MIGAVVLVLGLLYSAAAPWLKRYATPADACARWAGSATDVPPPFAREGALGFVAAGLSELQSKSDDMANPRRAAAVLCEDEKIIGPPHSLHDDIRAKGNGRYSLWAGTLYFSTSDGTDPNKNARKYRLVFPPPWYRIVFPS